MRMRAIQCCPRLYVIYSDCFLMQSATPPMGRGVCDEVRPRSGGMVPREMGHLSE